MGQETGPAGLLVAPLGEVLHNGLWSDGRHEPILSEDEWRAATRGFVPGRPRGRDLLSGRVLCGLCGRRMALDQNGAGRVMYRCRHRGQGCVQPARTNTGLTRAAVLGMKLLRDDQDLQAAIRRNLAVGGRTSTFPATSPAKWAMSTMNVAPTSWAISARMAKLGFRG
jgi:hypothetical protein